MPVILWLLGVPLSVIIVLLLFGFTLKADFTDRKGLKYPQSRHMPTFGRRPPEKRRAPREKGRAPTRIELASAHRESVAFSSCRRPAHCSRWTASSEFLSNSI